MWQYDAMMLSIMTFYHNPEAQSLFVVIWTAGMAAMMLLIVPMILAFNRLSNTNNAASNNPGTSNTNSQMDKHRSRNDGIGYPAEEGGNKSNIINRLRNTLQTS
jgi:hypothetical protein